MFENLRGGERAQAARSGELVLGGERAQAARSGELVLGEWGDDKLRRATKWRWAPRP